VLQRFPGSGFATVLGIVTLLTVDEQCRPVCHRTFGRRGQRPHRGMRTGRPIVSLKGCGEGELRSQENEYEPFEGIHSETFEAVREHLKVEAIGAGQSMKCLSMH